MDKEVDNELQDIYRFASLESYRFSQRLLIRLADIMLYALIRVFGSTLRIEPFSGWKDLEHEGWEDWLEVHAQLKNAVMAFWHDNIFLTTYYWRKYDATVLISKSFDGEYISRIAQRFGYGVIRGSSSRGGSAAFARLVETTNLGNRPVITVDGPRGPRHKAKKGALLLAKETGIPVIPMMGACRSFWELNNWDKTQIPKPFTRCKVFVAEPVFVPADATTEEIETLRIELETKLDELVQVGEKWRRTDS
ncbi:MAG: lysophospholipid acyltransferase family protein [Pyrinomonadaceae bacterium]